MMLSLTSSNECDREKDDGDESQPTHRLIGIVCNEIEDLMCRIGIVRSG